MPPQPVRNKQSTYQQTYSFKHVDQAIDLIRSDCIINGKKNSHVY